MHEYEFELPFPPSVNSIWRVFQNRKIISAAGRKYRIKAIEQIKSQKVNQEALTQRLSVSIDFYPPDKRKRDLDNFNKAPLDALSHAGFWEDDSQIDRLVLTRKEVIKGGKLIIKVRVI